MPAEPRMSLSQSLIAYDRRDPRLRSLPDEVLIEPVMGCNLRCPMCPVTGAPDSMDGRTPVIMQFEVYRRIIEQLSDRPRHILLTIFGEPLLHPRIVEFVALAKQGGHNVHIITNGTKLTGELAVRLIEARLDVLTVSIDGLTRQTYERLRVGASRDRVLANLREFAGENARRKSGLRIEINYIVSPRTVHERDAFFRELATRTDQLHSDDRPWRAVHAASRTRPDRRRPAAGLPTGRAARRRTQCVHPSLEGDVHFRGGPGDALL
jgi:sulfatase maturation enzyme AslB (radical SAM superfamily)